MYLLAWSLKIQVKTAIVRCFQAIPQNQWGSHTRRFLIIYAARVRTAN